MKDNDDSMIKILKNLTDEEIEKIGYNPDSISEEEYKKIADKLNVDNVVGVYILPSNNAESSKKDIFVPRRTHDKNNIIKEFIHFCSSRYFMAGYIYQHSRNIHIVNMFKKKRNIVILNLNVDVNENKSDHIDFCMEFYIQKICVKMVLHQVNKSISVYKPNIDFTTSENYQTFFQYITEKKEEYNVYETDHLHNSLKVLY